MSSSIFPDNFPQGLATAAFITGNEAAWLQSDSLFAINWFAENGHAILAFELWLPQNDGMIKTSIHTEAGPVLYVWSFDPIKDEAWEHYVQRSAREAAKVIGEFRWPEDAVEPLQPAYFNLSWANRQWFRAHEKECRTYC